MTLLRASAAAIFVLVIEPLGILAQAPSPPALQVEEPARNPIEEAKRLWQAGQLDPAIEVLQNLIASTPASGSVPEAYLLLGQILREQRKIEQSNVYYRRLLDEYPTSEFAPQARLGLAGGLLKIGQPDNALPLLFEAKEQAPTPGVKHMILRLIEDAYLDKHDYIRAIGTALEARALVPSDATRPIDERIRDLVNTKLAERDLRRLGDRYPQTFPGDVALLRLLDLFLVAEEDYKLARTAREFLRRFPDHEQVGAVSGILAAQRKRLKSKDILIGALLPLSGSLSPYGTEALNGIRIALDQAAESTPRPSVGLVTKDTEGDARQLSLELDDLLEDYRPAAVIGPLLTRHLKAVAPAADSREVVFVTPSATVPDVQRISRYLFNTAVNHRALLHDLAVYAVGTLGWKRFGILAAQDAYGGEMAQAFAEEVRHLGGEIIASETYGLDDTDFAVSIKRIKEADLKRHGKLQPAVKKDKPIKIYTPGIDAVFVPGEAQKVGLIAGQLWFHEVKVPILGTNELNTPDLIRIGGRAVEGTVLADSFFIDSPEPGVRNFVERYMRRFHEPPSAFAAQAYEATQLVLDAIYAKGATKGRAIRESLFKLKDFPGLAGPLTMSPAGYLERRYVLLQVRGGKFYAVTDRR